MKIIPVLLLSIFFSTSALALGPACPKATQKVVGCLPNLSEDAFFDAILICVENGNYMQVLYSKFRPIELFVAHASKTNQINYMANFGEMGIFFSTPKVVSQNQFETRIVVKSSARTQYLNFICSK